LARRSADSVRTAFPGKDVGRFGSSIACGMRETQDCGQAWTCREDVTFTVLLRLI